LKSLSLNASDNGSCNFSGLLHAVKQSNLDSISLWGLCQDIISIWGIRQADPGFQLLLDNVPSMKIRELGVEFNRMNNAKQQLIAAVKHNFSLRSLKDASLIHSLGLKSK